MVVANSDSKELVRRRVGTPAFRAERLRRCWILWRFRRRLANLANMADPVNMHEAKSALSRLVERALQGEDIVIARAGVPAVRLVPVAPRGKRTLGQWKGQVTMSDDFDAPLPEADLAAWEGKP